MEKRRQITGSVFWGIKRPSGVLRQQAWKWRARHDQGHMLRHIRQNNSF